MRILILNQFFWPDVAPTGQYLADVARDLSEKGHEVTVVCGKNSYGETDDSGEAEPSVRVIRVSGPRFKRKVVGRLLFYFTFLIGSLWHALRLRRNDIILTMTTPPMLSVVGMFVKAFSGMRHFIWEMDVFPDVLATTGSLSPNNPLFWALAWIQRLVRRHADGIIALGPCMKARLIADGTPTNLVHVAENWANSDVIQPLAFSNSKALNILYSGNLGRAHDIGTIADVIRYFRNDKRFLFSFAGGGVGREGLQELCAAENITNAKFSGYANRRDISEHLGSGDLGLVTELPACLGTVVPSKVYGLMAAGRPILFIGPNEATPSLLIDRSACGWHFEPGDARGVIELLEHLTVNRHDVADRGQNGLVAFSQYYDLNHGVARISLALGLDVRQTSTETTMPKSDRDLSANAIGS